MGEMNPREVVHKTVADDLGGIASCSGLGKLPRDRQQVIIVKVQTTFAYCACTDLFKKKFTAFIRDVRVAPEPLCVMTSDRQLNDLKRFCCNPVEFRPFTVDPTFDIGHFNVTPITYQHLLLENRRDGKAPIFNRPSPSSRKENGRNVFKLQRDTKNT